jgi:type II secretory pathway component PulF
MNGGRSAVRRSVRAAGAAAGRSPAAGGKARVSEGLRQHQARFWRKFLRLTRGRVPVLRSLEIILAEEPDRGYRPVLRDLLDHVRQGQPLSAGLERHPRKFSICVRELIRTAEKTGAWDEILMEVAEGLAEGTFD